MPSLFPLHFSFWMTSTAEWLISMMLMRCVGVLYGYCRGLTRLCWEVPLIRPHRCQRAVQTSYNSRALVVCSLKVRCQLISAERLGNMSVTVDPCRLCGVWEGEGHVCIITAQLWSSKLTSLIFRAARSRLLSGQRVMWGWAIKSKDKISN